VISNETQSDPILDSAASKPEYLDWVFVNMVRKSKGRRPDAKRPTMKKGRIVALQSRSPVPKSMTTDLRYVDMVRWNGPASYGTCSGYVFNLSSIFDPDVTGTGHQPLGHDQFALLYHHYQVISVKWRVTVAGQGTATGNSFADNHVFSTHVQANATVSGSDTSNLEQNGVKIGVARSGHRSAPQLSGAFNAASWFGVPKIDMLDTTRAAFGANPSEAAYLVISNFNTVSTTDVNPTVMVELTYTVRVTEPVKLGAS